jgi:virulence-associated protein VapD
MLVWVSAPHRHAHHLMRNVAMSVGTIRDIRMLRIEELNDLMPAI